MSEHRRCLVVRPQPGCAATVARVNELPRWRGVGVPLTERSATGAAMPEGSFDRIALTSAAALPYLDNVPREVPVRAIGAATATAARNAGFANVTVGMNGDAPQNGAEFGEQLGSLGSATILYPCAQDRRPEFEARAMGAGLKVLPWPVYSTLALPNGEQRLRQAFAAPPDGVLLHAPSGARAVTRAWPQPWHDASPLWLAYSETVLNDLPRSLPGQRLVASRPDDAALMELLKTL